MLMSEGSATTGNPSWEEGSKKKKSILEYWLSWERSGLHEKAKIYVEVISKLDSCLPDVNKPGKQRTVGADSTRHQRWRPRMGVVNRAKKMRAGLGKGHGYHPGRERDQTQKKVNAHSDRLRLSQGRKD